MTDSPEAREQDRDEPPVRRPLAGLMMGYPLDQLLDQTIELNKPSDRRWGIRLPSGEDPGTGNIVICGPAGSGKSTLGLQIAVACAKTEENAAVSAYISLESTIGEVKAKARDYGWTERTDQGGTDEQDWLLEAGQLSDADEFFTPRGHAENLLSLLTSPRNRSVQDPEASARTPGQANRKLIRPAVLLTTLTPRDILGTSHDAEEVFWRRYRQVECLLIAAKELERVRETDLSAAGSAAAAGVVGPEARAILPLVVIDSLNMFGPTHLSRNHVYQLFQLFKRYRRIGVFIVETGDEIPFDATVADVVIRLSATKDDGYAVRHLEVEKSRYSNCVRGLHPFKSAKYDGEFTPRLPMRNPPRRTPDQKEPTRCGIVVFPSLHHVVLKTDSTPGQDGSEDSKGSALPFSECFGLKGFESVLPRIRRTQNPDASYSFGKVAMLQGSRGTFKTDLALSFLVDGLLKDESVMLIRLSDVPVIELSKEQGHLLGQEIADKFAWQRLVPADDAGDWQHIAPLGKVLLRKLHLGDEEGNSPVGAPAIFEADFKGGHILPEEMVQFVSDVLIRSDERDMPGSHAKIRRVVFGDVSQIGVSYPFLRDSLTSGDLFLPAFVHLMRNYGVDLVMVGTTSGVADADAAVNKAATLADALVTCRFVDVFGKSQVVLSGDQAGGHDGTTVLPVIRRAATKNSMPCLELDRSYLEGIVGLETANPHRPGLVLQVFEDEPPHARYNREMEAMLRAALARPRRRSLERKSASEAGASEASDASVQRLDVELSEASDVSMQPFGADLSEAIHDSLDILLNRPVNRTVLCTVDEFSSDSEEAARLFVPIKTGESGLGNLNPSALIYPPAGSVHAWPYYCNVLLIAYKQSWFDSQKATSTKNGFWSPRTWQEVWQAASGPQTFWYDQTARETLACMLMDALVAAQKWELPADGRERERMLNDLLRPSPPRDLRAEETKELVALGRLMSLAWDNARASGSGRPPSEGRPHLSKDASVFVCWYSQLRELIAREPSLAGDFRVCALPGGGFRGDWFIGILRGSVSPELGQEVIEKLCRLGEEYKRFTRGVGLPVSASFLDRGCDYFAWPLAVQPPFEKATVPLTRVFDIHERAWLRSYITDYKTIRSTLSTAALQFSEMGQIGSMDDEVVESFVREVVGTRMFRQLRMLIS